MPVSPERQALYPGGSLRSPEWLGIRAKILKRAETPDPGEPDEMIHVQCECTGDCGLTHADDDIAESDGYYFHHLGTPDRCQATNGVPHPVTESPVVLTIAHLDHDVGHNDPANLRALCQRCHNRLDAPQRAINRSLTRTDKRGTPLLDAL